MGIGILRRTGDLIENRSFQRGRQACSQAVDVQQADITRCGGVTGFLQVAALCQAHSVPLSDHTAPALHTHVACAVPLFKSIEYFHDHVRIEQMFFDGLPQFVGGELRPDLSDKVRELV